MDPEEFTVEDRVDIVEPVVIEYVKNSEKAVRRLLTARIYPHMQLSISFRISSQFIYR